MKAFGTLSKVCFDEFYGFRIFMNSFLFIIPLILWIEWIHMNKYKSPRDKLICVLNACKLLMGYMHTVEKHSTSADDFIPILIYAVLKANPPNLVSNLQFVFFTSSLNSLLYLCRYIYRFRHPSKLQSESGYYLTNMVSLSFIIHS